MSEVIKKFMEALSASEENVAKLKEINEKFPNKKENIVELIKFADTLGITLTEADFDESQPMELDDDELEGVAGGKMIYDRELDLYRSNCACVLGGGGSGDSMQKTCACVAGGAGELTALGKEGLAKGEVLAWGAKGKQVAMWCAGVGASTYSE